MNEKNPEKDRARRTVEWCFLQRLCALSLRANLRQEYCAKPLATSFTDLANQIVFEEICALSKPHHPRPANELREHLPARVTARGFPDLDFLDLLATPALLPEDAETHLHQAYQRLLGIV